MLLLTLREFGWKTLNFSAEDSWDFYVNAIVVEHFQEL
jgi:hypothetical protein